MDVHSKKRPKPYGLKDPVVKLERCDKIWKTLQLIRTMQDKYLEDNQDWIKREPITSETTLSKKPPMTFIPDKSLPLNLMGEPNLPKPYIKYQPIFNNGNESSPPFQLAEKSRLNLYHCEVCSQEYCNHKSFVDHQEEVHKIVMPKKTVTKKERIPNGKNNEDLKGRRISAEINQTQSNKKLVSDENIDLQNAVKNSSIQADSIRCKLCGKCYKNIKKHMTDYHKIKYIGLLSKVTDQNSNLEKDQPLDQDATVDSSNLLQVRENTTDQTKKTTSQEVNFGIQNSTNISKRKLSMPSIGPCKRLRSDGCWKEESLDTGNQNKQLKCEICSKEYAYFKSLGKHRDKHTSRNEERQSLESKKNVSNSVDPESSKKTNSEVFVEIGPDNENDNDNIDNKTPRTRSSFTKDRRNSDQLEKEPLQIKCACGRTFRTTSILSTHKSGCKFLTDNNGSSKPSDARIGSERDSGISITIKKKNNSYEIVSKEGSDEEPSRNGNGIEEPELCEETSDSSSDNSDSSEFDDQLETMIPEHAKYSPDHCVLKLKLVEEEGDVDIGEEMSKGNSSMSVESDDSNLFSKNGGEVPFLRALCKKFFIKRGIMPKEPTSHKCQTCKAFLGSKEKLAVHIVRHKKLIKKSCSCGIKFTAMKSFDDHIAAKHPNSLICPYCKEKFTSIVGLSEHLCIVDQGGEYIEAFNESYPCPYCNITFNNINWLNSHMRSKHLDPNLPFQCYQCPEKFANEQERSSHSHKKHNMISSCSVCKQKFQSVKTKQKHESYHRGVGFPCHKCKKTYRSKRNQLNHVRTVHGDFSNYKLRCPICQKSLKIKSVKKHLLRHNSILKCELCDKVVYEFRNLERHILDCHGNENYPRKKCSICGVSFATKQQLDVHVMIQKFVKNESYKDV